ncbi:MAG: L-histidine N(alpha)-methyltransferase [Cyclobacteriaceae bacterium]|nr:L-histidine N(alpha)-methyltransferase [Cyclobacteriaceae bacterium]
MSYLETNIIVAKRIKITNHLADLGIDNVRKEIIEGLNAGQKYISSKFFYDEKGSKLFEDITQLPEYYPTRTEKSILKEIAPKLMSGLKNTDVVELGSGDCSKITILLSAVPEENLESIQYVPVDVSRSAINESAQQLVEKFPELSINGLVLDFITQLDLIPRKRKRLFLFLGSTLGNFTKSVASNFMVNLSRNMNAGDSFVLGLDLVKPIEILHKAYNDSRGVTADFNKNILNALNNIVETNFNIVDFEHDAFFNKEKSRIEMHLIAKKDVVVTSPYFEKKILIRKGENIHTENSNKYSIERIQQLAEITGLKIKNVLLM